MGILSPPSQGYSRGSAGGQDGGAALTLQALLRQVALLGGPQRVQARVHLDEKTTNRMSEKKNILHLDEK
jgi:hypothetical protein